MIVMAVDPGTTQSGVVVYRNGQVLQSGVYDNCELLHMIETSYADLLAIERFEARGMAIGDDSVQTILWTGRFQQAWRSPESVRLVKRSAVKTHLCGTQKATDANIRQVCIDRVGEVGLKASPGPTYGVKSHAWQALGLALTALEAT